MRTPLLGSPDELSDAAAQLNAAANQLRAHGDSVQDAAHSTQQVWLGTASLQLGQAAHEHASGTQQNADVLAAAGTQLHEFSARLAEVQRRQLAAECRRDDALEEERLLQHRREAAAVATDPAGSAVIDHALERVRHNLDVARRELDGAADEVTALAEEVGNFLKSAQPAIAALINGPGQWASLAMTSARTVKNLKSLETLVTATRNTGQLASAAAIAADAAHSIRRGPITGIVEAPWFRKFVTREAPELLVKYSPALRALDAAQPGISDVVTGGGYGGARGVTTRVLGGAEVVGTLGLRAGGWAAVAGGVAIGVWGTWKVANKAYDKGVRISPREAAADIASVYSGSAAIGVDAARVWDATGGSLKKAVPKFLKGLAMGAL